LETPPLHPGKDLPDGRVRLAQLLGGHLELPERLVDPLRKLAHVPSDREEYDRQDHNEHHHGDREGDVEDRLCVQGLPPVRIREIGDFPPTLTKIP